jgi:hypothetical protein
VAQNLYNLNAYREERYGTVTLGKNTESNQPVTITQDLHEKGSPPSMKKSRILAGDASSKIART